MKLLTFVSSVLIMCAASTASADLNWRESMETRNQIIEMRTNIIELQTQLIGVDFIDSKTSSEIRRQMLRVERLLIELDVTIQQRKLCND